MKGDNYNRIKLFPEINRIYLIRRIKSYEKLNLKSILSAKIVFLRGTNYRYVNGISIHPAPNGRNLVKAFNILAVDYFDWTKCIIRC